ncbi:hypothetical protein GCM10009127_22090 [Alteraurantiacibacter aestuarii]|uniref:hypothetical protein n=1 Tax=Alteraurantiacibacter aestuarii TaxID=650004 RepID=UPI0031D8BF5E
MRLAFTFAFPAIALLAAIYAAWLARKSWRNPDNWHLDPQSAQMTFHNWPEFGLSSLVSAICGGVAVAGFLI